MTRESWLHGWPRTGETGVLMGNNVRCVGCGKSHGTTTVVITDDDGDYPTVEPEWPFEEVACPVCAVASRLTLSPPEQRDRLADRIAIAEERDKLRAECLRLNHAEAEAMALVLGLEEQGGKLRTENARLNAELKAQTDRSDFAWKNTMAIEKDRQRLDADNANLRLAFDRAAAMCLDEYGCEHLAQRIRELVK